MAKPVKVQVRRQIRVGANRNRWVWVWLLLAILFVAAVRVRLIGTPLERDEGEYAYAGQLILQGIPPYQEVYNMKLPGTYVAYAVILALFGQTLQAIRLGLLLVNVATIVLMFFLARRFFDDLIAVIAAISFALFSLLHALLGIFAHATHFVLLAAVAGLLLLLKALESRRNGLLFWSGLSLGLAFLMKQHGAFFMVFALLYLLYYSGRKDTGWGEIFKRAIVLMLGFILPLVATCIALVATGAFANFWFWTVTYAREYGTQVPLKVGILDLLIPKAVKLILSAPLLWLLAVVGLYSLCLEIRREERSVFCVGLSLFSFLAITPGLYFREHYFILLLAAASLNAAAGVEFIRRLLSNVRTEAFASKVALSVFFLCAVGLIFGERAFLFALQPIDVSREIYGGNPFPESVEVAKYLRAHTKPSDTIAVLGSEPQIYFYSRRRSASGMIYMYPMMEVHDYAKQMQQEVRSALIHKRPKYIVVVNVPTSWGAREGSDLSIVQWADKWAGRNYELVGIVDIVSTTHTEYLWENDVVGYSPVGSNVLFVLRRKDSKNVRD